MDSDKRPVLTALRGVVDPEVGLDVVEMGLIYAVAADERTIRVAMTLTSRGCPMGEMMVGMAEQALSAVAAGRAVKLSVVWEPAWSPEMLGEEGRSQLGRSVA